MQSKMVGQAKRDTDIMLNVAGLEGAHRRSGVCTGDLLPARWSGQTSAMLS